MTPTREDLELYVSGNFDGDVTALERAVADDPALSAAIASEARLEMLLRDAGAEATFCPACDELVRADRSPGPSAVMDGRCNSCGAAVRPGGYIVERVLVSNAHGRMYVARDADGKQVALKELAFVQSPTPAAIAAFEREAKFLRALEHPAIPRFCASFEEGSGVHTRYYLAQELVAGTPLDRLDDHWYTEPEIIDIAKQVLAILVYLQSLSPMVIHRDIKPANLIKRADGTIALVDFGAAYVPGSTTAGLTTVGTFGYMPIEQLAGIVDATTDPFALGATLQYLLTRQEPWRLQQTKTTINVSPPLRAFIDRLTAADPRNRFPSAKDSLAALERPVALVKPRRSWRLPLIPIAAAAALLATGGGVFHMVRSHSQKASVSPMTVPATPMVDAGASITGIATLKFALPAGKRADLFIDGERVARVSADTAGLPVPTGTHQVKLVLDDGTSCVDQLTLTAAHTTTAECMPRAASAPSFHNTKIVDWTFKNAKLHDVLAFAAASCGVNVIVPSYVDARVTINLVKVACDQALEVLLESHGLWYAWQSDANLLRIAPRKDIAAELLAKHHRPPRQDPPLPAGKRIDIDLKNAPLRDALRMIAAAGTDSGMNIVVPESIDGKITIRTKDAPWDRAFEAVLATYDLWYRYRAKSNLIRVGPRKDLDAEPR